MKYEYNGNLTFAERTALVAKEIKDFYPFLDTNTIKKAAMLEDPIIDNKNFNIILKRLYNILYLIKEDKDKYNQVLNDLKKEYNNIVDSIELNSYVHELVLSLTEYINGRIEEFPELERLED